MLRLDALEIAGFKSFAEKTRVRFTDGITCIIGPNGCGKSNLADAIGWVLGTQTAHSLRGERMEDVIFSGTQSRKSSGFVEATLVFSRADGHPILLQEADFSGEALEISRKLYRSGESIYSIQEKRCRLKDIPPVLEEAGLGFASYALIAQGRIGWFLSAKPLERRAVIEEAARIIGYKSRRRAAELKLEMARQNLLRVNDIIQEIERQLRSLKRQAAKARRYRELKQQFQEVQRQKLVLESRHLKTELERSDQGIGKLRALENGLQKELSEREREYQKTSRERERLQSELSGLRQRLSEVRLEVELAENSIQHHHEQIESIQKSLQANASEQQTIVQALDKVDAEVARFEQEQAGLAEESSRAEAAVRKQRELVQRHKSELEGTEKRLEELRTQLVQLSADAASLGNLMQQLEQQLKSAQSSEERLQRELAQHGRQLQETLARSNEIRENLQDKQLRLAQLQGQLREQEEKKKDLQRQLEEINEQISEIQNQLIAQRERLQSLQEIEVSHSQYSEGVQKFLRHLASSQKVKTGGTLADFVETSPEYERLVEEFLDQELEYIVVDSLKEAVQGISELKTLKSGKCTFLSLSSSNGFGQGSGDRISARLSSQKGVYGTLADLLEMKPEVKEAFYRALPQRAEAIVVCDLDRAFELAHSYPEGTFITLSGESLTPRGLLSASASEAKQLGLLSLKRQKKELERRISQLQKKLSALQEVQQGKHKALETSLELFGSSESSLRQLEKEVLSLTHHREQWESEERRQRQALDVIQMEVERVHREQEEQRQKIRKVEAERDEKNSSRTQAESMLSETQKSLQQLRTEFDRLQEQLHLMASQREVLEERRSSLERTLGRIAEQRQGLQARQEAVQQARSQQENRLEQARAAVEGLKSRLESHRHQVVGLESELREKEEAHACRQQDYPELERALVDLRERKTELQEKRSQLEVERARLETQLLNVNQQCLERLQMSLEEASTGLEESPLNPEQVTQEYADLRDRLETFGPINMTALEEYQAAEERYNFLSSQRQDIEASIADTTKAIQEINRRSREKFRQAFETINGHFNEVFGKLFGGGECGMRLLDEEDVLESGIDIYAQPPGKKLQNVSLLSGGEKALTVFALLMALFQYRPSRFCVLDEVDAPLDDVNVARFTQLIREMSQQIQFIIITHNKRTMETADAVLGVTMEEPGVSQIVSVQLGAASGKP